MKTLAQTDAWNGRSPVTGAPFNGEGASARIAWPASGAIRAQGLETEAAGSTIMNESTTETTSLDFERVAQAARLVAPVTNGTAKNRRMLPVPPPPPSLRTGASTPLPFATAQIRSAPNAADLLAWEEAAEQLEPDWATPVDGVDEASEHTAPLVPEMSAEPSGEATKLPLIGIEASDAPKASEPPASDALAMADANLSANPPERTKSEDTPVAPSVEPESDLEALARSITKGSHDAPARSPLPGRPLPAPPGASRPPAPLSPPPAANRMQTPPLPPAPTRTPLPVATVTLTTDEPTPIPVASVTRTLPGPTPPPLAAVTRPTLPPLSRPPSSRPLPPLAQAPSRPPPPTAFRPSAVPPPATSRPPVSAPLPVPRSQLPTLPRRADLEQPELLAPSLLELRRSPAARRFYAQLAVAAVLGALLATILFALIPRQTTTVSITASQPAPAAETKAAPAVAHKQQTPAAVDAIPPPRPVKSLSVDDLEREPAAETKTRAKPAAPSAPAAASPAPKLAAAIATPAPAAAAAPTDPATAAAKPEAATPVAAKGTLHINSVPPANVAIDGRPLGMTPKIVRLSPGSHRVALIGPGGRRSQTVNVGAGQTASVSVKF
jgi:hypothetical protein